MKLSSLGFTGHFMFGTTDYGVNRSSVLTLNFRATPKNYQWSGILTYGADILKLANYRITGTILWQPELLKGYSVGLDWASVFISSATSSTTVTYQSQNVSLLFGIPVKF